MASNELGFKPDGITAFDPSTKADIYRTLPEPAQDSIFGTPAVQVTQ